LQVFIQTIFIQFGFNRFDCGDPESYVHRIGRTGRAGKGGMSVTFVTPNEMSYLHVIENLTKKRMTPMRPPTEKEAFKGQLGAAIEAVETKMEEKRLGKKFQTTQQYLFFI